MNDNDIIPNIWAVLTLLRAEAPLIHAEIEDGVVYLEGLVASRRQKRALAAALSDLAGVRRVVNCLAVEQVARLPHALPAARAPHYQTPREAIITGNRVQS